MHAPLAEEGQSVLTARPKRTVTGEGDTTLLLEQIVSRENLMTALKRVKENKGAPGVDGMTTEQLPVYLSSEWPRIKQEILECRYTPQAVRRVEIPKANSKGKVRLLGIPTCLDRLIQQAILQILSPLFEREFLDESYGFRPGKSAHQAISAAKHYISEGYKVVVDIDLENFFDRVCHDKLMSLLARRIDDKRLLLLIRRYLDAGVMFNGVIVSREDGVPQGGPLSPLLSNVMLHELDVELARRGHRFCRFADDCNIYVKTKRAGERVFKTVTSFLEKRLKLRVNLSKSAVDRVTRRKFLGFSFHFKRGPVIRIAKETRLRFKQKVKELTRRIWSVSTEYRITKLNEYLRGWCGYFALAETPTVFEELERWTTRRVRQCILKTWKLPKTRRKRLRALGVNESEARKIASSRKGTWALSLSPQLHKALSATYLRTLGLLSLKETYIQRRQAL